MTIPLPPYSTPFDSIMLGSDSYKVSHRRQYKPGTTFISSYLESRGGDYDWTQFFGLQYLIRRYLAGPVITKPKLDYAESIVVPHLGGDRETFGRDRWEHIIDVHGGCLPLHIRAVPEGLKVPTGNVLMTNHNTCDDCFWLTNFVETILVQCWYPITVATLSQHFRLMLRDYLEETGSSLDALMWMLHDFGCRGVSSLESAAWGGLAHLSTGFGGTDTMPSLIMGREFYDAPCAGYSIPAYEHSTVTSWGREHEVDCYRHALRAYPKGPLSVVSDSYDFFNAIENIWGVNSTTRCWLATVA
jgi:nicotinamide phosphoribosyltransferase